jgi:CubicO group peptidase (beta-lactamase class C family)
MKVNPIPFLSAIALSLLAATTGVRADDATPFVARHNLTAAEYQSNFTSLGQQGYQLIKVSGYEVNNASRFAAIWEKKTGAAWKAHHNENGAQFLASFNTNVAAGYRLTYIDSYEVGGAIRYASIWSKEAGAGWYAYIGMTSSGYQQKFNSLGSQGYRLTCVSGSRVGGNDYYAAIWQKVAGPAQRAHHGQSTSGYQATFNQNISDGYRPVHVSAWAAGSSSKFASIWEKVGGDPLFARHGLNSSQYQAEFENAFYSGYRIRLVNGYTINGSPRFVAVWDNCNISGADLSCIDSKVKAYMNAQGMPGFSLAIARNGKLVFARGYGEANTSSHKLVSPVSQFRIASVSKPITGVAVMKLVEQGKLSLDDKVFGAGALLGTTYGTQPYSNRVKSITVRQLLSHTSGWSNEDDDPMFKNFNTQKQVIDYMIDTRGVKNAPGSTYEYLNFGHCVMGRVIEKVTGQTYENFVKSNVLAPSGITQMGIGNDSENAKLANEVTYYPSSAYNLRPGHMDAHGGWVASAKDLVKLSVHVDGLASPGDILSASSRNALLTGTAAAGSYGLGWSWDGTGQGHNGAMRGTLGFVWQTTDNYSFAILANERVDGDIWFSAGKNMVLDILKCVKQWPSYDLYSGSHQSAPIVNPNIISKLPLDLMQDNTFSPIQRLSPEIVLDPKRPGESADSAPYDAKIKRTRAGMEFVLEVPTQKQRSYEIEASTDTENWETVDTFVGDGEVVEVVQSVNEGATQRFFRVISEETPEKTQEELEFDPAKIRPVLVVDPKLPVRPVVKVETPVLRAL